MCCVAAVWPQSESECPALIWEAIDLTLKCNGGKKKFTSCVTINENTTTVITITITTILFTTLTMGFTRLGGRGTWQPSLSWGIQTFPN